MLEINKIHHGDCLIESEKIESGSVDLILTDLPYGTIKGLGQNISRYKKLTESNWDIIIEPIDIYEIANRILRKNGKMILFSQQPFTTALIKDQIPNMPFNYTMIWDKGHFANCLIANKACVNYMEEVLLFSKMNQKHDFKGTHPLRSYFNKLMKFIDLELNQINSKLGHRRAEHTFYVNSTQFLLCTEKTYKELINVFKVDLVEGFKPFSELKTIDTEYRTELLRKMNEQYPSTFNLWEGCKYKSNILKYKKDYTGYHPTQKPVLLLEDLIKTFSNKNDLIVDLTCGSGSTCVAAIQTHRNFIGIEKEKKYVDIANQRIEDAEEELFKNI